MRSEFRVEVVLACVLLSALLGACKSAKKALDAGPPGEPCASPGGTETGCGCGGNGYGHRVCQDDKTWGQCQCSSGLSDGALCNVGDMVKCPICRDAGDGVWTRCLAGGTFDCSCGSDAGTTHDAGMSKPKPDAGNAKQPEPDAGMDAGMDAVNNSDAG